MYEQTQAKFIQWLGQQLGTNSEEELRTALEEMGEEGIAQAFQEFQQVQSNKKGGKLEYLKRLQAGGTILNKKRAMATFNTGSASDITKNGNVSKVAVDQGEFINYLNSSPKATNLFSKYLGTPDASKPMLYNHGNTRDFITAFSNPQVQDEIQMPVNIRNAFSPADGLSRINQHLGKTKPVEGALTQNLNKILNK